MTLIIAALVVVGGLLWLIRVPSRPATPDARDQDALDRAETEVRDLGAMTSPDDADEALPDWGPGTGGPVQR
jgi:hypothetical protein